jgi:hypothetical protein
VRYRPNAALICRFCGNRFLRELRVVGDIFIQIIALISDELIRFKRRALVSLSRSTSLPIRASLRDRTYNRPSRPPYRIPPDCNRGRSVDSVRRSYCSMYSFNRNDQKRARPRA